VAGARVPRVGWVARIVGWIGARVIYALIWVFGRTRRWRDMSWLAGPLGREVIGGGLYDDVAAELGLTVERAARDGGLIPDLAALRGDAFDPDGVHPQIRAFYEHTTEYAMDVWSRTFFPSNIALWLLVKTISRQVNQLDFPLSPLDTSRGMNSEIVQLRRPDGTVRYTGWYRTTADDRAVYAGFYMSERIPGHGAACIKAVFPMPRGNATVLLRPASGPDRSLVLDSSGRRFGDPGFYRVQARGARDGERVRVWYIRTLRERFHIYVDDQGVLRGDHTVRFLGLPVLALHYKIFRRGDAAIAA
jgi:hypothetical protein